MKDVGCEAKSAMIGDPTRRGANIGRRLAQAASTAPQISYGERLQTSYDQNGEPGGGPTILSSCRLGEMCGLGPATSGSASPPHSLHAVANQLGRAPVQPSSRLSSTRRLSRHGRAWSSEPWPPWFVVVVVVGHGRGSRGAPSGAGIMSSWIKVGPGRLSGGRVGPGCILDRDLEPAPQYQCWQKVGMAAGARGSTPLCFLCDVYKRRGSTSMRVPGRASRCRDCCRQRKRTGDAFLIKPRCMREGHEGVGKRCVVAAPWGVDGDSRKRGGCRLQPRRGSSSSRQREMGEAERVPRTRRQAAEAWPTSGGGCALGGLGLGMRRRFPGRLAAGK